MTLMTGWNDWVFVHAVREQGARKKPRLGTIGTRQGNNRTMNNRFPSIEQV